MYSVANNTEYLAKERIFGFKKNLEGSRTEFDK